MKAVEIRDKARQLHLCFICFGKHFARKCNQKQKCPLCNGWHNQRLCTKGDSENVKKGPSPTTGETAPLEGSGKVLYANIKTKNVTTVMQVVKTTMRTADGEKIEVNLLFDGGSDRSFITQNLVKKLKIAKCGEEKFAFASFGGTGSGPRTKRKIYDLNLGGVSVKLAEIPVICSDMFRAPVPTEVLGKFSVEFGEDFSVSRSVHIDILVGLDYYWQLVKPESIRVDSLVAQKTRCGWMLSGAWQGEGGKRKFPTSQFLCLSHVSETMIRNMWELESLGITDHAPSQADPVMEKFNSSVCFEGGRYTVSLPWKENFILSDLIDNEGLARKRLQSLSRKLEKKPELRQRYDQSLADLENEGIIVEVPENEMDTPNPVFYLPHRPVVKESSTTTKVRPVFDASAQGYNGLSLNDCLETGPSLVPNLVAILMRFRRWKIAFSSDITKAFLQIRVKKQDQDVHRFLWEVGGRIRVMRFDRVPFGNKASPFLLNATIKQHLSRFPPSNVVSELNLNLYVDDWLSGADTIDEAYAMMTEARRILSLAGLPLAKWTSNCEEIQEKLFSEFEIKHVAAEVTKLLGLKWINSSDCFSFDGIDTPKNVLITKRVVLSCIARLFDPLGLLAPFTMAAKIIFQVLWMEGLDWDMKIPDTLYEEFEKWLLGAGELRHWNVPRCYVQQSWSGITSLEIHVFCDASEKGYGACAYLKIREAGSVTVTLVTAKARVAPLKKITLPRLELMAALLGARLMRFIQRELQLPSEVTYKCYTDSMIVLGWIKGDPSRWKQFVSNRTREIQQETDPHSWSHCPGTDNPADLLTRGMSADSLMGSLLWLNGPIWLSEDDVTFPGAEVVQAVDLEALALEERQITQCVSVESDLPRTSFPISRWSSLRKATGVMGWVLRFLDRCTKKRNESSPKLTNEELLSAHDRLMRIAQMESFGDEIKLLKANKLISRSSPLYKLFPFIGEDGLLRAKCRLNYSDLSYDEKFPIILPKGYFSLLLCRDTHVRLKHAGVNQMLSTLRAQFWIVGLRSIARRTKWECLACKTIDAKACQEPAAPLMEARSKQSPPFSVVGLDYAGPVYCTDFPNKKFYVLLFTCAVVRAVHLELVESMSLPVFLLAFRKFVARRGIPTLVYSDNAKTFQNASPELFKIYGSNCPRWRFSAPRAPWWGGWWERMAKNMKWALKKTIGNKCLDRSELEATLTEVEVCINSRPLTFVGDCIETGHPLTPFHFLLGRSDYLSKVSTEPVIGNLLDQHRLNEARLAFFWKRWQDEYLKQLPLPKRRDKRGKLQLGSVVLVREDNSPRLCWPIGVIEQLIEGKDGVLRTVRVKTKTGSFVRPIQRIHDLELNAHPDTSEPDDLSEPVNLPKTEKATVTRYGRVIKTPTHII